MSYFASITQNVIADAGNSSTTNLSGGATFTGTGHSTAGMTGLQVSMKADKNCIVYVDQGPDGTNWDVTDSYDYYYNIGGDGWTVQAVSNYMRVRVKNNSSAVTTYFRLQTAFCPIASAIPRSLSRDGRMQTQSSLIDDQIGKSVKVSALKGFLIVDSLRLVGTAFEGTTKDTNFWAESASGSGAATQSGGEVSLATGTTANSTIRYQTIRKARYVPGSSNQFTAMVAFVTAGTTNNLRRVGMYTTTDGFFFELNGTTFSVGTRIGGIDTLVSSGSFNGKFGTTFSPVASETYYGMGIEVTGNAVYFGINGILLHSIAPAGHISGSFTLPVTIDNINSGGQTANVVLDVIEASIRRYGKLETDPTYKFITGATTTVCKYGPGRLHTIVNNDNAGAVIAYDQTSATAPLIADIDLAKVLGSLDFHVSFYNGLTLVTTGAPKLTVIYE